MFYSTISAEILRICRATTEFDNFVTTTRVLIQRMRKQGASNKGIINIINKLFHRHSVEFEKYNKMSNDIVSLLID